jgi:hypothetical protein
VWWESGEDPVEFFCRLRRSPAWSMASEEERAQVTARLLKEA